MIAEIVTIGTELLLGEIVDTNSAHIAQQLTAIGVDHFFSTTVGDNLERIMSALRLALSRADVVITTGGLGRTVDDVTREAVGAVAWRELEFQPRLLEQIEGFFQRRGATMSPNNRRQAYVPAGAVIIENPVGTAPAFAVELDQKAIVSLPGVPHEMAYLLREVVLPYLSQRMGEHAVILVRQVHSVCIGESMVDQQITDLMHQRNPSVGTRAHPGQTDICITAKADSGRGGGGRAAPGRAAPGRGRGRDPRAGRPQAARGGPRASRAGWRHPDPGQCLVDRRSRGEKRRLR